MRRALTVAAAVAALALLGASDASAQGVNQAPNQDYVAMGDSYSSGNGAGTYYEGTCYRSNLAYGPLIHTQQLTGSTFSHPACSGAQTKHFLTDSQNGFPPQVTLLGANTDYVTLTIGGNDAGFVDALTNCAIPFTGCADPGGKLDQAQDFIRDELPARLDATYAAIRQAAPNAVVTVLGYPRLFKPDTTCAAVFSPVEVNKGNATADLLSDVIRARVQAAGPGFAYVDSRSAWIGHGACDSANWINSLDLGDTAGSFHPTSAGYAAYAGMGGATLLAARRPGQTIGPNGHIAFTSGRDGNAEIYVANANGSFPVNLTGNAAADTEPAFSPDGTKLAFTSNRDGDNEIYVVNADGSGLTKLTDNGADDAEPTWSPNGDLIAFRSNRDGDDEIFKMKANGTAATKLTDNSLADSAPAFSPDGSELAFQRVVAAGNTDVFRINSDGQGQLNLTPTPAGNVDSQPAWAPDGNTIAFQSNRDGDFEIFTVGRAAPPATPAVAGPTPVQRTTNTAADREPSYSPDGTRLTFTSNRDGNDEIYTATATGAAAQRVTNEAGADALPSWQGDQTPPQTAIDSGPSGTINTRTPSFEFSSSEPGSSFECRIDGGAYAPCASPHTTAQLPAGPHSFDVRATDPSGNQDPTPASRSFTVELTPATTAITAGPTGTTADPTPSFEFVSSDPLSTFECELDGGGFAPCTSPFTAPALADGPHTFKVKGTDSNGTPDPAPVAASFTVDATAPDTEIDFGPPSPTNEPRPSVGFSADEPSATFECRIDGGDWDPCTSPWQPGADLPDGPHGFDVRATDAAGNTDASPASASFTIDTAAPVTSITSPPPGSGDDTPTFTFEADEPGSSFECSIDGAPFTACDSPLTTDQLADGAHSFAVRAIDAAGNTDPTPASVSFSIDVTAPHTTIATGPGASGPALTGERTPTWTFFADDPGATFECRIDSGAWTACDQSFTPASPLADGAHSFAVRATDGFANTDPTPAEASFTVDATKPQTSITAGPTGAISNPTPSFEFSSDEPGASFECRIDGGGWDPCTSPWQPATALGDGAHSFDVRATDAAGNTDQTAATRGFTVDTAAPVTTIDVAPPARTNDVTPSFQFSADQSGSSFECRIDGGAWNSCTSPHTVAALSAGAHGFDVRATDPAGNTDPSPASAAFTIDTTAPATTITAAPASPGNDATPSFDFSADEPGSSFECKVDAAPFTPCSPPHQLAALDDGQHTFAVRAIDAAGNVEGAPRSRTFLIDTAAPDTRITAGPEGATPQRTAAFGFTSTEPGSSYECSLDGAPFTACGSTAAYDGLADGPHAFRVRATDAAGNPDPTPAARDFTVDGVVDGLLVKAKRKQRAKRNKPRVKLTASAGERVEIAATGALKAGRRKVRLKPLTTVVEPGGTVTLKLAPARSGLGKLKRALAAGQRVRGKLTVTATDELGNEQAVTLRVKLR